MRPHSSRGIIWGGDVSFFGGVSIENQAIGLAPLNNLVPIQGTYSTQWPHKNWIYENRRGLVEKKGDSERDRDSGEGIRHGND